MDDNWKAFNLKIEHGLGHKRTLEWERIVKHRIRQNSLNLASENEIERYSDKYFKSLLSEDMIKEIVSVELMPPEISRTFGEKKEKNMEDIEGIESSASEEYDGSDETENSNDVENDYEENFYENEEDDELTEEKDEEGFF
ncbi:uncharacterized protein Eint_100380 [Encephalitozoon intestinalis ATCC 50506]|uniref:DNA-directed RNA polymerase III subunit n=1 Tax=Encephalitozoon intestinalis (strain ATCC 50506) TaxID=876142 RepID=E0S9I0_ENCIT|nr:uncharacterized protein Eint_100380 [Encephalitozoon intestinalis ATCC 50506]ADM12365.1 hypothetical protein Eint_100380 [Encephalitozoon intestinalis ATCC 50506]UTX46197.1 hypothetical protein GPK93_10g17940 [Encephalitozoon intestinalis]